MSDAYLVGQVALVDFEVRGENGQLVDPGSFTVKVRVDAGEVTTYAYGVDSQVARLAIGKYQAALPLTVPGVWYFRSESEVPNKGASEGKIVVSAGRFS